MKKLSKLLLALSFVLSITTSAFAVTVVSWGGAYTESQKLGYGDPTAAKLGIPVNWVDYTGGLSELKLKKKLEKSLGTSSMFTQKTLSLDVTKEFSMNSILIKTLHLLQMEHLQVKTSLQACLQNVQLETFCTLGTMLITMQQSVLKSLLL